MQFLNRESLRKLLPQLEAKLGTHFKNPLLLETACIHTSYVNEHKGEAKEHNERLEFLGDAVLELVTTEFLYQRYPEKGEGELTSFRSALVKGTHLAEVAQGLEVGRFMLLSKGEEKSGGREKNYLLANTLEAIIGAMYLDQGFAPSHAFINTYILTHIDKIVSEGLYVDAKSRFQELSQERLNMTPTYTVIGERGPDHSKVFEVGAYLGEELIGKGEGSSKQNGEQAAAEAALKAKGWI